MNKKTIIMTVAGLGLVTTLFAGCGPKHCQNENMHPRHEMKMMHDVFEDLALTSEQKSAIKDIMKSSRDEFKKEHPPRGMMPDASTFMTKDSFDKTAFIEAHKKQMEERMGQREAMLTKKAENFEKIFTILTPEQREQFITISKERKGE